MDSSNEQKGEFSPQSVDAHDEGVSSHGGTTISRREALRRIGITTIGSTGFLLSDDFAHAVTNRLADLSFENSLATGLAQNLSVLYLGQDNSGDPTPGIEATPSDNPSGSSGSGGESGSGFPLGSDDSYPSVGPLGSGFYTGHGSGGGEGDGSGGGDGSDGDGGESNNGCSGNGGGDGSTSGVGNGSNNGGGDDSGNGGGDDSGNGGGDDSGNGGGDDSGNGGGDDSGNGGGGDDSGNGGGGDDSDNGGGDSSGEGGGSLYTSSSGAPSRTCAVEVSRQGSGEDYQSEAVVAVNVGNDSSADVRITIKDSDGNPVSGVAIPMPNLVGGESVGVSAAISFSNLTTDSNGQVTGTFTASDVINRPVSIHASDGDNAKGSAVVYQHWNDLTDGTEWDYEPYFDYDADDNAVTWMPQFFDDQGAYPLSGHSVKFIVVSISGKIKNDSGEYDEFVDRPVDDPDLNATDPKIADLVYFSPATSGDSGQTGIYVSNLVVVSNDNKIIEDVAFDVEDQASFYDDGMSSDSSTTP